MFYNIIISNLYKVKNTYIKILIVYISRTELLLEEMRGSNLLYCFKKMPGGRVTGASKPKQKPAKLAS
jgi:hypothetical protein